MHIFSQVTVPEIIAVKLIVNYFSLKKNSLYDRLRVIYFEKCVLVTLKDHFYYVNRWRSIASPVTVTSPHNNNVIYRHMKTMTFPCVTR